MADEMDNFDNPPPADDGQISEDDWAAAMAEQVGSAQPAIAAQPANIFPSFNEQSSTPGMLNELDMILDIPVQITVELGRTKITIKNLLQLAHGSVVELDAMAGEPMDVLVNGTLGQAKGDVKFKTVLADAFKVVRENTPFNNIFYTKPAWDYLLTYRLQEAINPGYLRRMERRLKKDDGITFMFPPSEYATGLPF